MITLPSPSLFFCYLQLRHAVQSQFPDEVTVQSHVVECFLICSNADKILSFLYLLVETLVEVLDCFTPGERTYPRSILRTGVKEFSNICRWWYWPATGISNSNFFTEHTTPHQRLSRIYPTQNDRCPKRHDQLGNFMHVLWSCHLILEFWEAVVSEKLCGKLDCRYGSFF